MKKMTQKMLLAGTLAGAASVALAAGADIKVQNFDTKVHTKGAVINSNVLGTGGHLNLGGIQARTGKADVGKFRSQIKTEGAIINSNVLGTGGSLNVGGIQQH